MIRVQEGCDDVPRYEVEGRPATDRVEGNEDVPLVVALRRALVLFAERELVSNGGRLRLDREDAAGLQVSREDIGAWRVLDRHGRNPAAQRQFGRDVVLACGASEPGRTRCS